MVIQKAKLVNTCTWIQNDLMSVILQGLEGNAGDSNEQLKRQLDFLYNSFVMYCGSIVNIRNVSLKFLYQYD